MFARRGLLLGGLAWSAAPLGWAAANEGALLSYRSGAYLQAAERAAAAGGADNLTLAARALLALVVAEPRRGDVLDLIARGQALAERGLRLAPDFVEARLHLAAALGLRGRREGPRAVLEGGYVPRSRALIGEALTRAPREAWAHAMLGGWHLELLRRGGRAAATIFDADAGAGIAAFTRARALAPRDPVIPVQFAVGLIGLNRDLTRVRRLLDASQALPTRDAFEAFIQRQAAGIARAAAGGADAAREEAEARFP